MTGLTGLTVMIHDHHRPRTDTPSHSRSLPRTVPAYRQKGSGSAAAHTRRKPEMHRYSMEFDRSIDPRPPEEERWAFTTIWRS